uniref:DDE Tnp4 domain-containing protein n=1 Tax=Lactuca sativa TaxID=4236 RepID=A0A9R1XAM1_LACSA|nr:hypothetical protein LSAT_V11C500231220 [Lactuca sativa]
MKDPEVAPGKFVCKTRVLLVRKERARLDRSAYTRVTNMRNTMVSFMYRRAKSTTSRCFHRVLHAVVALESYYIQQPKGDVVPKEIQEKKRFYPYVKNLTGVIDGTHVRVKVPNKDAARYRGRKGYPTINVLAVCSFDLSFTYILTRWEGRYCLVDAGFPHTLGLMTPNRGVFGVLKRRFLIVRSTQQPFYSCDTESNIFVAFCILHNFLLDEDRDKKLEYEVLQEVLCNI